MNILICVKQVPGTQKISMDPATNTLIREGIENALNPFDGYALEAATRLQDKDKSIKIYALSMGPPQAETVLRECMAISADASYLASDQRFAGSDAFATGHVLCQSIKKIEADEGVKFDMIFCGNQAIDGDTAQVGPLIAELLDLPLITYGLTCEIKDDELHVLCETEIGKEVVATKFPCLVTFTKPNYELRLPSIKRKLAVKKLEIPQFGANDLEGIEDAKIGLAGSPMKVKKTFVPEVKKESKIFNEGPIEESVQGLAQLLVDKEIVRNIE